MDANKEFILMSALTNLQNSSGILESMLSDIVPTINNDDKFYPQIQNLKNSSNLILVGKTREFALNIAMIIDKVNEIVESADRLIEQ